MRPANSREDQAKSVVDFWLDVDPHDAAALQSRWLRWFGSDPECDREIAERFGGLVAEAAAGRLTAWAATSEGRLALILLLDQFPRSLFRGSSAAFAHDAMALALTEEGMALGADRHLSPLARVFFYMPLQHAESPSAQREAVRVFDELSREPAPAPIAKLLADAAHYARLHADIIAKFGRFPHRNRSLGRESTAAERAYLDDGGPTFGQ